MSCVVGIAQSGRVVIGGDSQASAGCAYDLVRGAKVFRSGSLVIGCTGEPRVNDVVRYIMEIQEPGDGDDLMVYMVRVFVPALRAALTTAGVSLESSKDGPRWAMLIAVRGRLFALYDDFQIEETIIGFSAIGCATGAALGALHVTQGVIADPAERVRRVLAAAEACDTHVSGPFVVESV